MIISYIFLIAQFYSLYFSDYNHIVTFLNFQVKIQLVLCEPVLVNQGLLLLLFCRFSFEHPTNLTKLSLLTCTLHTRSYLHLIILIF